MELSHRMGAIASLVTKGNRLADIGTDHAYIPIALTKSGWIPSALAMDIGAGPLKRARDHVIENHLADQIELRLSDGLIGVSSEEADTILIAGMGGELITHILREGSLVFSTPKELIVQPQSEIHKVRRQIHKMGYGITNDFMLKEEGKYYVVMRAECGKECYETQMEYQYGKLPLCKKDPVLLEFLKKEKGTYESIKKQLEGLHSQKAKERILEVEKELAIIKGALEYYDL